MVKPGWKLGWVYLLLALAAGCAQLKVAPVPEAKRGDFVGSMGVEAPAAMPTAPKSVVGSGEEVVPDFPRMIVYTAFLELRVEDPKATLDQVWKMTEEMGGYVVASAVEEHILVDGTVTTEARITVRVPADRLQEALAQFRGLALEVLRESLDSEDVTEEYVDLEARLRHLRATEEELLRFLEEAETTEDVLQVYRQLNEVREEIERLEGRKRYLEQVSQYALIEMRLRPKEVQPPVLPDTWSPLSVFRSAVRALVRTLQGLATLGIWLLVYVLPVALILGGVLWTVWKGVKRFLPGRKASPPKE